METKDRCNECTLYCDDRCFRNQSGELIHYIYINNETVFLRDIIIFSNINIYFLFIEECDISDDAINILGQYLKNSKTLHTLIINYSQITDKFIQDVLECKTLTTLEFFCTYISEKGYEYLSQSCIYDLILGHDIFEDTYNHISQKSKNNYIKSANKILLKYFIKDISNIIINCLKC